MPVPQTVLTLIENFERNLDAYRDGKYNETQVRRDFIDPLFKALGWDMWVSPIITDTFIKRGKIEGNVKGGTHDITQEIQHGV